MTVLLHPEELLDKRAGSELTEAERARLDAHLAVCAACRLEVAFRDDVERAEINLAPPKAPSIQPTGAPLAPPARRVSSRPPRVRRPALLVALAAAFLGGGAFAAVASGLAPTAWLHAVEPSPPTFGDEGPSPAASRSPRAKPAARTRSAAGTGASGEAAAEAPEAPVAERAVPAPPFARETAPRGDATDVERSNGAVDSSRPAAPRDPSKAVVGAARGTSGDGLSARRVAAPAAGDFARFDAGAAAASDGPATAPDPASALFAAANRARRDGNVARAIALYRSLEGQYPSAPESELSRALVAKLLLDRGDAEGALAGFDRYLGKGAPVLGAEALVGKARALEALGKKDEAALIWSEVVRRFPGSVHARLAATRLSAPGSR